MTTMIGPLRRAVQVAGDRRRRAATSRSPTPRRGPARAASPAGLRALGLEPGDRVAVVGGELPPLPRALPAVPARGLVVVPLNQRHTERRAALRARGLRRAVLFAGADRPASGVEHVVDLATATRRCSPAPTRRVARRRRGRPRRAVLHGRHDRRGQGRDAHPPQPRGQRDPLPGLLAVHAPTRAG